MPDYRPIRPRVRWGSGYTNELIFRTPLDEAVAWGEPSDGSEFGRTKGGIEDAWIEATEYFLRGAARHIPTADVVSLPPATGWEGAAGWDAFLKWMRDKNVGRFYPDGRNLLDSPLMNADADSNGRVNDFTGIVDGGATGSFAVEDSAQRINLLTSGAAGQYAYVYQDVFGVREGDTLAVSFEARCSSLTGGAQGMVRFFWYTSAGVFISSSTPTFFTGAAYSRQTHVATAPATSVFARAQAGVRAGGSGSTGTVHARAGMVERRASASASFIDNPGYEEVYLVEPMRGAPGLEASLRRRLDLVLRKKARTAFAGY